jgi:polysaccharide export outer membrane protein
MKYSVSEKGIMKKALAVFLLTAWVLSITAPSIVCAQDGKAADPSGKAQGAVAADNDQYVIGPEDVLLIYVWKEESITKTVPVRIDGKISLPLVNDIQAAGLTPLQLKEALTEKLKGFVENPTITVTVMEANSFKVYVSGEVKNPGVQHIRSEITLVKLIIMAGGFTEWADQKKILIITKEKGAEKRMIVNYRKIIEGEEPDIVIKRGDTVIVR